MALISIFLGGFIGQYLTTQFTAYKERLQQEQLLSSKVFELTGACRAASNNLVDATHKDFASSQPYREKVAEQFNEVNTVWRAKQLELDMQMQYQHADHDEVLRAWYVVSSEISKFMEDADKWNRTHSEMRADDEAIKKALDDAPLDNAMKVLIQALERTRSDRWFLSFSPQSNSTFRF